MPACDIWLWRERSYLVAEHSMELAKVFSIDSSGDNEDTHPHSFCHSCWSFMRIWHTRGSNTPSVERVFAWDKHCEPTCMVSELRTLDTHIFCQVCHHFRAVQTRGGDNAGLKPGRPSFNTAKALSSRLTAMSPASPHSPLHLVHTQTPACFAPYALVYWIDQWSWDVGT